MLMMQQLADHLNTSKIGGTSLLNRVQYEYFPNATKTWLIVKDEFLDEAKADTTIYLEICPMQSNQMGQRS